MPTSDPPHDPTAPSSTQQSNTGALLFKQDKTVSLSKSPSPQDFGGFPISAAKADVAVLSTAPNNLSQAEQISADDEYDVRRAQCLHDCDTLPKTLLRRRWPSEASCHKNMLRRSIEHGRVVSPAIRKFRDFLREVGPKPTRTCSIHRTINDDPEYAPGKIRWADKKNQTAHRSSTHLFDLADGRQYTTAQLSKLLKVPEGTIRKRRYRGYSDDEVYAGRRLPGRETEPVARDATPFRGQYRLPPIDVVWLQTLEDCYPGKWWTLMPADRKMLQTVEKALKENGLQDHVEGIVSYALRHWDNVLETSKKMFEAYPLPTHPTVYFLYKHLVAVVDLWLTEQRMRFVDRRLCPALVTPIADKASDPLEVTQVGRPRPLISLQAKPEPLGTLEDLLAPVDLHKALA